MAESQEIEKSVPTNVKDVTETLQDTVGGVWGTFIERLPFIVAGIVVLIATAILVSIFTRVLNRFLRRNESMRDSLRDLLGRLASIALWFVGLTIAAIVVFPGIDLAKALGGLGLLSVAVGLAFQDIFENFFAGILLLWRFPFEKGDFIECGDVEGKVADVQIRMTLIRKSTGELIIVPNSYLFKNPVEVLTDKPLRRVHITAGVGYGEDVAASTRVIIEALESCETVSTQKPVEVYPSGFGASSVDIDVAWWTDSKPGRVRRSRGEVITSIKRALDEAGIEIPFPYRTLTFSEPLKLERS
ncbi:mechanosensitive ion channel family protein [Verrucomicrobiales bacterium BCK34]|nr:mechanosensitive ion channel family protein [Verrucomicrobiales bacterium BCK34]